MPKQQYALEPGGPKRLEISWKGIWKNVQVSLDGQLIGTFESKDALKAGQTFPLPDGTSLHVQFHQSFGQAELRVLRNGQPLPGSGSDPAAKLKLAYGVIFFVAVLNILLGAITEALDITLLRNVGVGIFSAAFGAAFVVLGVLVMRRSMIALIIAIALFGLDAAVGIALAVSAGGQPGIGGLIFRVFLIIAMVQGVPAITALKRAETAPPAVPYPLPPRPGDAAGAPSAPGAEGVAQNPYEPPPGA